MVQVPERDLEGARQPVTEHPARCLPGIPMLLLGILLILAGIAVGVGASHLTGAARDGLIVLIVLMEFGGGLLLGGLTPVSPGHARVIQLFGRYCLRQQQASAVIGARARIVEGAVGMVRTALQRLEEEDVVGLDEERKAAMVSNLLVVLCSEQATQQVVNTGSLY
jgi:hypothetical protein